MNEKIKILFLAANPVDATYRLRLDKEIREIETKIQIGSNRDSFELISQWALRPNDLQEALLKYRPQIVHFSGHGSSSQEIILEDNVGNSRPVGKEALANLFKILKDNVQIVVLNACYAKNQAEALNQTIDYTVGMNEAISDEAAIMFSASFYRALAFGLSVKDAFSLAKNQLELEGISESETPELLIRTGVDDAVPFALRPLSTKAGQKLEDNLTSALQSLTAGIATDSNRRAVRHALMEGRIVIEVGAHTSGEIMFNRVNVTPGGDRLHVELDNVDYEHVQRNLFPEPPGIAPPLPGLIFIGREDALYDVKKLIVIKGADLPDENLTVVRGWPGVGKTTLVGVIGRDPDVIKEFPDGVLWASLDQKPNLLSTIASWGRALGTDELLRAPTLREATTLLASFLQHKRMLLILDDVWEASDALPFLQACGSKSTLLVTTRVTRVAEDLTNRPEAIYVLPVLSEDNALRLMSIFVPTIVEQYQEECRQLVRDLEYLPLALHVAGRLLKTESKMGWGVADLLRDIKEGALLFRAEAPLDRAEGKTIPTVAALLRRSTDLLDEKTRDCFAFLGAFAPKPASFDLGAMRAVWQVDDPKPIVRKLVNHGLLEPTGSGRFQMHALLVQHARLLLTE
jgi:hypothetical protein